MNSFNFRGCIFDLDGVIVDTAKYHYLAWNKVAKKLGFEISLEENEQLKGISRKDSLEVILKLGDVSLSSNEFDKTLELKNDYYLIYNNQLGPQDALPGVADFIEDLISHNIKISLGSASRNGKTTIEKLGLTKYFDAQVDGNDVTNSKPDPEVFLKGASLLDLDPKNIIVFEDALKGIEAAIAAGCYPIGIGEEHQLTTAKFVLSGFEKLTVDSLQSMINDRT